MISLLLTVQYSRYRVWISVGSCSKASDFLNVGLNGKLAGDIELGDGSLNGWGIYRRTVDIVNVAVTRVVGTDDNFET